MSVLCLSCPCADCSSFRYASYAAVAMHDWVKAHSFLLRWLHPMDEMFGAAEVSSAFAGQCLVESQNRAIQRIVDE